jgi:hypothetical protein
LLKLINILIIRKPGEAIFKEFGSCILKKPRMFCENIGFNRRLFIPITTPGILFLVILIV